MGKALRVIAVADTVAEANAYMAAHDESVCVAVFGPLVLMADKYDPGTPIPQDDYAKCGQCGYTKHERTFQRDRCPCCNSHEQWLDVEGHAITR